MYGNHLAAHGDDAVSEDPFFDDDFASFELFDPAAHFELNAVRGRFVIVHVQGGSEETRVGFGVRVLFLGGSIRRGGGSPGAVTVNEEGEQSAIDIAGDRDVIWLGHEATD